MNGPEKKVFILALLLFFLGVLVKISPWNPLPQIETFPYSERDSDVGTENFAAVGKPPAGEESPDIRIKRERPRKKAKAVVHFPLSINRASAEELCAIKGVGPKLAERIVAYRASHGPFSGPKDLRKVSGIGKKKAETIIGFVIFD